MSMCGGAVYAPRIWRRESCSWRGVRVRVGRLACCSRRCLRSRSGDGPVQSIRDPIPGRVVAHMVTVCCLCVHCAVLCVPTRDSIHTIPYTRLDVRGRVGAIRTYYNRMRFVLNYSFSCYRLESLEKPDTQRDIPYGGHTFGHVEATVTTVQRAVRVAHAASEDPPPRLLLPGWTIV